MELLKANQVSYSYKSKYQTVDAVKNVTCSFGKGKMYAIMGRSGSGKSTFLSLLAGINRPSTGEVLYGDISLNTADCFRYRKEEISVVYQSFNLFPLLTVLENAKYPLELNKVATADAHRQARESLLEVGIKEGQFNCRPDMLSGGEQQRVAIARALAKKGKVILADEPTGNLDSKNGQIIIELFKQLAHERGITVIVITHDIKLAEEADARYYMQDGKLSENEIM